MYQAGDFYLPGLNNKPKIGQRVRPPVHVPCPVEKDKPGIVDRGYVPLSTIPGPIMLPFFPEHTDDIRSG